MLDAPSAFVAGMSNQIDVSGSCAFNKATGTGMLVSNPVIGALSNQVGGFSNSGTVLPTNPANSQPSNVVTGFPNPMTGLSSSPVDMLSSSVN